MTVSDWLDVTPSDLLGAAPSDWLGRAVSGWPERSYGDLVLQTTPNQWWSMMYGPYSTQTPSAAPPPGSRQRRRPGDRHPHGRREHFERRWHDHECCCDGCDEEPCECFCCIGDVDLTVFGRVGEERVVPIVVENERRREATVRVELSGWTTRGGNPAPVETVRLEPTELELPPCGERTITLVVRIGAPGREGQEPGETDRLPDVDGCEVMTADLRLIGCDHRPVRIAIAILPRYCDPYRIHCGCACC